MLIIIRGPADSNRENVAQEWIARGYKRYEADDFFVNDEGEYHFNPHQLEAAHQLCLNSVKESLRLGHNTIVTNTATRLWEFKGYLDYCWRHNIEYDIVDCLGFGINKYNTPHVTCVRQRNRFQPLASIMTDCVPPSK